MLNESISISKQFCQKKKIKFEGVPNDVQYLDSFLNKKLFLN